MPKILRTIKPRFLIVTEGQVTEPRYFEIIRRQWCRDKAIVIRSSDKTSPRQVVQHAIDYRRKDNSFSKVFCVVDHDHRADSISDSNTLIANANKEFNKSNGARGRTEFTLIVSRPCFELWLLWHIDNYARPGDTCQIIQNTLKLYPAFSHYNKNPDCLTFLNDPEKLDNAKERAAKARNLNLINGSTLPTSDLDILINQIRS